MNFIDYLMKLHLGCGDEKLDGYVNCDVSKYANPDKIVDLEKKLPFANNSVTEVVANHIFEHIKNFNLLMNELHRVCKDGAMIKGKVPFYASVGAFQDPTHVRFFTPFTFDYFGKNGYSYETSSQGKYFEINKIKLKFGLGTASKLNWLIDPLINLNHRVYCKFFAWVIPASEIEFNLGVKK